MPNVQKCLTLLGTASIQDYVFRSNRLKENIGASHLVWNALECWRAAGTQPALCEVVFVGGGNAALVFDSRDQAVEAVRLWSRELLDEAPGLRVVCAHTPYVEGRLAAAYLDAQKALFINETGPPFGRELGALPVTRPCPSTGLAADVWDGTSQKWISEESHRKRCIADKANSEIGTRYKDCLSAGGPYTFPEELEKLGIQEGESQIAIVHADGNGIGQILANIVGGDQADGELRTRLGAASGAISTLAFSAFQLTLADLSAALPALTEQGVVTLQKDSRGRWFYPVRPIVDGGDDLTFVCHGKLGLSLAARYLAHFETESRKHVTALGCEEGLTACAGVFIMPQKFPFARGYQMAESLAASAKRARKRNGGAGSWLDFQLMLEGSAGTLEEVRRSYWQASGKRCLLRRPYRIGSDDATGWNSFESIWSEFHDLSKWPRSRAKQFLLALTRGEAATKEAVEEFTSRGRTLPGAGSPRESWRTEQETVRRRPTGVKNPITRTVYFDPLEVLDHHAQLITPAIAEERSSESAVTN